MADNVNAMRDYQAAILMDPNYGLAYFNSASILLLHRQYNQAIEHLDKAIESCKMKDESTYQNRAIAKAFINDATGAFRDLCEAIKYDKYSAHIYMNRALLLYKMENYKLAEKDLNTAIALSPNDALLFKLRADCRGKLEDKTNAISDYKKFMDLQDRSELKNSLTMSKKRNEIK
jgi:tetratricopeptide (TPR) repeat protein